MAASHAQSPGPGPPPAAPPPQNRYPTQHPPPNADQHSHSSRSSKHQDTHVYHTGYQYPPSPEYDQRDPSPPSPPAEYYDPNPPQPPPSYPQSQHQPYPPSYPPPPAHSPEKRHKSKSRSHRHDHHSSPAPPPPPPPSSTYEGAVHVPGVPPPAVRVCRVLTLLIEDKRHPDGESMLAEVRVPLKQLEGGEEGYWADAQEVTEELQKGPSRIDGAAKVYTQRGKYKQYFLRISADGDQVCQPANLMVSRTRTLDIFIEDVCIYTSALRSQSLTDPPCRILPPLRRLWIRTCTARHLDWNASC
ncbi:hypothetical protein FKP32DRAFT_1580237 [Trametes sanguinea]|nr:hypothetical protein FKP32DRAFT_1580237 [Trametes sanguinea]